MTGRFAEMERAWQGLSGGHDSHDAVYEPHCLNRAFRNTNPDDEQASWETEILQERISPESIQRVIDETEDYEAFFRAFEVGPHNSIPQFVMGDWLTFTAPNGECVDSGDCEGTRLTGL